MGKEILMVVDAMSNERGVEKDVIFEAIEEAIAAIAARVIAEDQADSSEGEARTQAVIDKITGDSETFRYWTVVEGANFMNEAAELCVDELPEEY